jgi:sterol desaturase/sphingolipid hydroxylase (fatty acid hydroxylase superfamily)
VPFRLGLDDYPGTLELITHITIFGILEDTTFYWAHRLLHHRLIYKYIHKKHHEYQTTIGVAAEYAHPIEFIGSNVIPFAVGPRLLNSHIVTMWIFLIIGLYEVCE